METDKRKTLNSNQTKRPGKTIVKNIKKRPENGGLKSVKSRETESKASVVRPESRGSRSDRNKGDAFETMVIHYADDEKKAEQAQGDVKMNADKSNDAEVLEVDGSSDLEKEGSHEKEDVSDDSESAKVKENVVENEANKLPGTALAVEEIKEVDVLDEVSNGTRSDDERFDGEEHKNEAALEQKIEEMGTRIEKLEEELREVAALEISLYSVVPEHGSSAHKVHTPARRLSRLYIHACKHWTLDKRATIAKNTISGLILIAKSCSNDVPRLTFWLSNTMVLREIICQAFGSSRRSNPFARFAESNGVRKSPANLKWKGGATNKQQHGFMPIVDDWQETGTFVGALEKVESWIFSRMVESVWWQALTPYMQTPTADSRSKSTGKPLGPSLGDHKQGSFSIELWRNAFQDAFHRLCPVRGGGHDCGCLPVMARMVMKQCVSRLDVAMFNAILRESEHEIPTDPVSDPILDSKVLPIPAGDLSFGSGAQLKNSVGNWTRWLMDAIGMDAAEEEQQDSKPKMFQLLNELSDLLMLPKDMLMDRSIRKEVCPSISLTLVKRILCNFTPDEFCPDAVPGAVLEALNAESIVERRLSGETARSFPYSAAAVSYSAPSSADVAEKVAEAGEQSPLGLGRSVSMVQRKGYTSDEELEDLDSPLTTIIDKLYEPSLVRSNGNGDGKKQPAMNARYELLREVWS